MFKCSYYLTLNDFELLGVHIGEHFNNENIHFVKNVQIWSFFRENTDQKETPCLEIFREVS